MGDEVDPASCGLGYTCRKGLKPESPNQDSWTVMKIEGKFSIYAVFDGHGQKGHDVSNFVKDNLPKLMLRDQRFRTADMEACLENTKTLLEAKLKRSPSLVITSRTSRMNE